MKTEDVSAEEKVVRYFWYIIDKIKKKSLIINNVNKIITYDLVLYPKSNDWNKPNTTEEQLLITKLIGLGVIEEANKSTPFQIGKENRTENPKSAGITYYFKIYEQAFSKFYQQYEKLIEQYNRANEEGNTLIFYENGNITYISLEGKVYETKLRMISNPYKVLNFLVNNPRRIYGFDELINKCFKLDNDPTGERRIRDSIGTIIKKLRYLGGDIFETQKGYGLKCKIQIRK